MLVQCRHTGTLVNSLRVHLDLHCCFKIDNGLCIIMLLGGHAILQNISKL